MKKSSLVVLAGASAMLWAQSRVPSGFEAWPVSIETRIYAGSFSRSPEERAIKLTGCRNEFLSAQLAARRGQRIGVGQVIGAEHVQAVGRLHRDGRGDPWHPGTR